jgi:P4 family phage/plasmid primase-like protien
MIKAKLTGPMLRVDGKQAIDFLRWLEPTGVTAVYMLTDKGMVYRTVNPESITPVLLAGFNTYYQPARVDPSVGRKKASKEGLLSTQFHHVDIDPRKGADPATEQDRILRVLDVERPKDVPIPSAVIFSGRGYQALWRLKQPLPLPEYLAAVEAANLWVMKKLGAPAGTHNVDRLLRLPGSWNALDDRKIGDGYKPCTAEVVWLNEHTYNLEDFGQASVTTKPTALPPPGVSEVTANPREVSAEDLANLKLPRRIEWLIANGHPAAKLDEYTLDFGKPEKSPDDRNVWVLDVACALVRCGVPDDMALGILLDKDWGISAHNLDQKQPVPYARRQLARAKAFVAQDAKKEAFDLKTDPLVGAPKKVKTAIKGWRKDGTTEDEDIIVRWLIERLGTDEAKKVVESQLGAHYLAAFPRPGKDTINGKNLPEMVSATLKKVPHIKTCENEIYVYENGKYRHCTTTEFYIMVQDALRNYEVVTGVKDPKIGLHQFHVDEIAKHFLRAHNTERCADDVILFRNGYLRGGQFHASDPSIFVTGGPDCNYDPSATCPEWEKFLAAQWQDDPDSIALLQEMLGLFMVDDMSRQAAFLMIGPPRSGKGLIIQIIKKIIGNEYFGSFSLSNLSSDFGLESMIGKTVAAAADVRGPFDQKTKARAREVILGITGGDDQSVNRKGKSIITTSLRVRFIVSFNEEEDAKSVLIDGKGAIAARLRTLKTTTSFTGREDPTLLGKLELELPGIANWACKGLERLRTKGFTTNAATRAIREMTQRTTVREFLDEMPITGLPSRAPVVWQTYKFWSEKRGIKPAPLNWFVTQLKDADPEIKYTDNQVRCSEKTCNARFRLLYKGMAPADRSVGCEVHEKHDDGEF